MSKERKDRKGRVGETSKRIETSINSGVGPKTNYLD